MSNSSIKKLSANLKFVYSDNNSISIVFQNNDLLMGVVGEFNLNLKGTMSQYSIQLSFSNFSQLTFPPLLFLCT